MMDPYKILEIPRISTYKEIREKYLSLAKQHHPDKNQNSKDSIKKFQDIESAYRQIVDPTSFKGQVPPKPSPPPIPKFKKNQGLDAFLNELYNDGRKKTGKKKDKWL